MTEKEPINAVLERLDECVNLLKVICTSSHFAPAEPPAPLLYDYLDEWIEKVKKPKIKPKSLRILKSGVRYVKAGIKNQPLNKVKAAEMQQAIENVPFSYMREVVYNVLTAVFHRALLYDYINDNPAEKLERVKHRRQKGRALTNAEQARFIEALEGDKMRPLFLFYLLSGCRSAEALALRWADVDYKSKRIYIRGTKTETAERYIPLFPQIAELLKDLPQSDEQVFPFTDRQVRIDFDHIRNKNGFKFRLHDLRHTFATRCLESGIALNTVSKWLGHKSAYTTAGVYQHVQTDFEQAEASKIKFEIKPRKPPQ